MISRQLPRQKRRGWFAEVQLPQPHLDGDFPYGGHAQEQLIRRVDEQRGGIGAHLRVAIGVPQKRMGIQEEFHSMYSFMSSSGASKSGAI